MEEKVNEISTIKNIKMESIRLEYDLFFALFKHKDEAFLEAMKIIDDDMFAHPLHQKIYARLVELYRTTKVVPSLKGFYETCLASNKFSKDEEALLDTILDKISKSPIKKEEVELHARQIRELYIKRKLGKFCKNKFDELKSKDVNDVLFEMEKGILELRKKLNADLAKNIGQLKQQIDEREKAMVEILNNPVLKGKVKTGLFNFDRFISGLSPGSFAIFIARSGEGKSMMLMRTAVENFKDGIKTIIITIEMSHFEYLQRLDSCISGIKHDHFTTGDITTHPSDLVIWKTKVQTTGLATDDLLVYYVPENCTPSVVDLIIESCPFKPQLVIVDYAGDMSAGIRGLSNYEFRAQSEIFKSLKELAGKHSCVLFTAQQVQRGLKKLDKESGSLTKVATERADMVVSYEIDDEGNYDAGGEQSTIQYLAKMVKYRHGKGLQCYFMEVFTKMTIFEKAQEGPMYANVGGNKKKDEKKEEKKDLKEVKKEEQAKGIPEGNPLKKLLDESEKNLEREKNLPQESEMIESLEKYV